MKRAAGWLLLCVSACGPGPTLEIMVDGFSPRGEVGAARISVFATELGEAPGEGEVTLVRGDEIEAAQLLDGRARFEVTCPAAGAQCREPVSLEARWKGLVARYDGRLSKPSVQGGSGVAFTNSKPVDRGVSSPEQAEATPDAGLPSSVEASAPTTPTVPAMPQVVPPPEPWDASFRPGVDVVFVVAFRPQPANWGTRGGAVSISPILTREYQTCTLDESGTCMIRGVRAGEYDASIVVWYGGGNSSSAIAQPFGLRVPWNRTQITVPLGAPW
jgi:hypothetical protein